MRNVREPGRMQTPSRALRQHWLAEARHFPKNRTSSCLRPSFPPAAAVPALRRILLGHTPLPKQPDASSPNNESRAAQGKSHQCSTTSHRLGFPSAVNGSSRRQPGLRQAEAPDPRSRVGKVASQWLTKYGLLTQPLRYDRCHHLLVTRITALRERQGET